MKISKHKLLWWITQDRLKARTRPGAWMPARLSNGIHDIRDGYCNIPVEVFYPPVSTETVKRDDGVMILDAEGQIIQFLWKRRVNSGKSKRVGHGNS